MNSIVVIAVAVLFLALLLIAARLRSRAPHAEPRSVLESESAVRLPPLGLLERCLSAEDVEFTAGLRSPRVLRLLLSERRRLALCWIHQTRHEVVRVVRLHRQAAGQSAGLRPASEFSVLFYAMLFVIFSQVMVTAVYFYGPLRTQSFLQTIRSLAHVLADLSGRIVVASPGTFSAASSLSN